MDPCTPLIMPVRPLPTPVESVSGFPSWSRYIPSFCNSWRCVFCTLLMVSSQSLQTVGLSIITFTSWLWYQDCVSGGGLCYTDHKCCCRPNLPWFPFPAMPTASSMIINLTWIACSGSVSHHNADGIHTWQFRFCADALIGLIWSFPLEIIAVRRSVNII